MIKDKYVQVFLSSSRTFQRDSWKRDLYEMLERGVRDLGGLRSRSVTAYVKIFMYCDSADTR